MEGRLELREYLDKNPTPQLDMAETLKYNQFEKKEEAFKVFIKNMSQFYLLWIVDAHFMKHNWHLLSNIAAIGLMDGLFIDSEAALVDIEYAAYGKLVKGFSKLSMDIYAEAIQRSARNGLGMSLANLLTAYEFPFPTDTEQRRTRWAPGEYTQSKSILMTLLNNQQDIFIGGMLGGRGDFDVSFNPEAWGRAVYDDYSKLSHVLDIDSQPKKLARIDLYTDGHLDSMLSRLIYFNWHGCYNECRFKYSFDQYEFGKLALLASQVLKEERHGEEKNEGGKVTGGLRSDAPGEGDGAAERGELHQPAT